MKRSNARSQPRESPFYDEWWIEADTYAVGVDNGWINTSLVSGRLVLLREGWGANDEAEAPPVVGGR